MNPPLQKKGGNLFKKAPMIRGYIIQSSQKRSQYLMNPHLVFHGSTNSEAELLQEGIFPSSIYLSETFKSGVYRRSIFKIQTY